MKRADIEAHYAEDIKGATNSQLFAIIRGEIKASKQVKEALWGMANAELISRGVQFPAFTARFAF